MSYYSCRKSVVTFLLLSCSFFARAATITARLSSNWNSILTWSSNSVPTAGDVVIIPNGFTVTVNVTTAVCSSLTLNTGGRMTISANDKLTISGALSNAGTITTNNNSNLLIGGSLTNTGAMTVGTGGTLTFDGAANSIIGGTGGTYTISGTIVLNMGSAATALDVQDANFITGINSGGKYYFTFTRGTFRMDNSGTLNNAYNSGSTAALTIPYGVVLESDAGTMNLATKGTTGNVLLSGELFINGGTVNVQTGQTSTQDLQYAGNGGTPQLYISSGSLTVGSGFNARATTDYIDFHMTGGTMLVTSKIASGNPTFQLQNVSGGKTFMSGGLIILEQPGQGNNNDLDMGGANISPYSVTGGTVQFGTSTMPNNAAYFWIAPYSTTNYPNLDVETNNNPGAMAETPGNINALSLYIGPAGNFDATNIPTLTITSSNGIYAFDEEGSFVPGTNMVSFAGGVSQLITSSAHSSVSFYNLKVANTSGNVVLGVSTTVTNVLSFTSGDLDASSYPLTINNGSKAITGTGNSSYVITGDGVTKTGYLAIKALPASTPVSFPIGTSSYYLPATINPGANTGTAYSAFVYPGVTTTAMSNGSSISAPVLSTMADGTWAITRTAGAGTATLGLNWASAGTALEGTKFQTYGTNIGITQYSGSSWGVATGSGSVATETASASMTSFSEFSVIGTPVALPIVLADFEAAPKDRTTYLAWDAFPDGQAASFTVQRSTDGAVWAGIGVVQADATATVETAYSYTDATPAAGENYYRLFIQNEDGSSSYSAVRAVAFTSTAKAQLSVYPNPANTLLTINVAAADAAAAGSGSPGGSGKSLVIRLVNTAGQVLQSRVVEAGVASLTMNTGAYPAGVYYVEIVEGGKLLQTTAALVAH